MHERSRMCERTKEGLYSRNCGGVLQPDMNMPHSSSINNMSLHSEVQPCAEQLHVNMLQTIAC